MEPEKEFRRRCLMKGFALAEAIENVRDSIRDLGEGKTVLPKEKLKEHIKRGIDDIEAEVKMTHEGYGDGYLPCIEDRSRLDAFYLWLEEADRKFEGDNYKDAESALVTAKNTLRLALTGAKITTSMEELEWVLLKKAKGERMPWE